MSTILLRILKLGQWATRTRPFRTPVGRSALLAMAYVAIPLLYRLLPNPVQVKGCTLYWNPGDRDLYPLALLLSRYEPETTACFKGLLQPGMTVVDIGAHIGYYSLLAAQVVNKEGKVYAFEPEPSNFTLLVRNTESNGQKDTIIPIPKAVSRGPGTIELLLAKRDSRAASFYHTPAAGRRSVKISAINLDSFFCEMGWPAVHLIKMDIEGAEKEALEGMKELALRNPGLKLIMEFAPENLRAAGVNPGELFATLQALGFQSFFVIRELPDQLEPLTVPEGIPDLVAGCAASNVDLLCQSNSS